MFDIFIHPIHLSNGQEQPELPGFLAASAPRRAARNRTGDFLFVFLTPGQTTDPFPPFFEDSLHELVDAYFVSTGSVTSGMRTALDGFNEKLLKNNLDNPQPGQNLSATINMAVEHNNQVYIAHAGSAHSQIFSQNNIEDLYDPIAGNGLGVDQVLPLRYYQAQVQAGDILVFWNNAPEDFLVGMKTTSGKYSLEQLRRRVLNLSEADNRAVIIQFQQGNGQLRFLKPRSGVQPILEPAKLDAVPPVPEPVQPARLQPDLSSVQIDAAQVTPVIAVPQSPPPEAVPVSAGFVEPATLSTDTAAMEGISAQRNEGMADSGPSPTPGETVNTVETNRIGLVDKLINLLPGRSSGVSGGVPRKAVPRREESAAVIIPERGNRFDEIDDESESTDQRPPRHVSAEGGSRRDLRERLASIWFGGRQAKHQVDENGKKILERILPGESNEVPRLSPAMMLFIAVAVPLIVVSIATTIYFQNGPDKQHAYYLTQAKAIADQSKKQNDVTLKYQGWSEVIGLLDKAEKYEVTDASRLMRVQYQQKIDDFDGIYRLAFQPLALNLDSSIVISRMAANSTDVYMLDSTAGRVLRMTRTGQGFSYNLDNTFNCGPGNVGTNSVGPLVNFTLLPLNSPNNASVLTMDASGNLLFCIPGNSPLSIMLPDPEKGVKLGNVANFLLDGENLYVLDTKNNAIYIYVGYNLSFPDRPHLFFDLEVPNLKNILDMDINGEDLFLLHEDGLLSRCTFRLFTFSQTRCIDPSPYQDTRKGREGEVPRFKNTHFTLLQATTPPDPSLFLMDDLSSTLFQFGLSQTLHRQIRMQLYPDFSLPSRQASAFTVSTGHILWMAFGNELFFTQLQ